VRRHVVVGGALVVGVALPLLTRALAEDTLVTAMLVELPTRSWWLLAGLAALAIVVAARGALRLAALLPPLAVGALTFVGATFLDERVQGPRVAAWNLAKGTLGASAQLAAQLRALNADVVCLSEAGRYHWLPDVDVDALARDVGAVIVGSGEVRALVRRPPVAVVEVPLPPGPSARPLVVVDIDHEGQRWRVGCLHLMPRLFLEGDSVDRGEARHGSWREIAAASRAQGRALRDVLAVALQAGTPIDVVAGDWNHQAFGHVVGDVVDLGYVDVLAGEDRPTFGRHLWAKRIDHALVLGTHAVREARVLPLEGSDHAAIVTAVGPHRGR
jgi:endonuclease/exonuclease/phosphatase (EEP) superfamily protein YafD